MERVVVATRNTGRNTEMLRLSTPVAGSRDVALVLTEADGDHLAGTSLPGKLSDVDLSSGVTGMSKIPYMRVALPDNSPCVRHLVQQHIEHVLHVHVPDIPRTLATKVGSAVEALPVAHFPRIQQSSEVLLVPALSDEFLPMRFQVVYHLFRLTGAIGYHTRAGIVAVCGRISAKALEAMVPLPRLHGESGVVRIQVFEHQVSGGEYALNIQPVEAYFLLPFRFQRIVVSPKPCQEVSDVPVSPHPRGVAVEDGQRLLCRTWTTLHILVEPQHVRPWSLDRHQVETQLFNETRRDACPLPIEFVGAVAPVADHHDSSRTNHGDQGVVAGKVALGEWIRVFLYELGKLRVAFRDLGFHWSAICRNRHRICLLKLRMHARDTTVMGSQWAAETPLKG